MHIDLHARFLVTEIPLRHWGIVLDLMDPIGPIGGPAFSSQTLIAAL